MTNRTPGAWMENLTWPEIAMWIERDPVLLVPIGAISKEHGHHLPMKTDFLVARELASRVIERLPILVAPVITHGYYPAFVRYPGSQHLSSDMFIAMLKEILRKFARDGFKKIAILNTGISTEGPVNVVARDIYSEIGVMVRVANIRRIGGAADHILEQEFGGHADEAETSMVLAIAPELVKQDRAQPDYGNTPDTPETVFERPNIFTNDRESSWDYSETGALGDPTLATAEKGEIILRAMVDDISSGLRTIFPELSSVHEKGDSHD